MGLLNVLGDIVKDGVSVGLGLSNSNEAMIHEYVAEDCWGCLKYDDQYTKALLDAFEHIRIANRMDNYLNDLILPGWVYDEAQVDSLPCDGKMALQTVVWRLRFVKGHNEESRSVRIRFRTPHAIQAAWNKQHLIVGYVVDGSHTKESVICEISDSDVKSFLGIKFGSDYHQYVAEGAEPEDLDGDGLKIVAAEKMNPFCGFCGKFVVFNKHSGRVWGVLLIAADVDDAASEVKFVIEELEEVLHTKFAKDGKGGYLCSLGSPEEFANISIQVDEDSMTLNFISTKVSVADTVQDLSSGLLAAVGIKPQVETLSSFLGAKFGDDFHRYVKGGAKTSAWLGEVRLIPADLNRFMSFAKTFVLVPKNEDVVIGAACSINEKDPNVGSVEEFMEEVRSLRKNMGEHVVKRLKVTK